MEENREKLKKAAWEVYSKVLENLEIPDYVTIHINDDGTFFCLLNLNYRNTGYAYIHFKPSTYPIEEMLQFPKQVDAFGSEIGKEFIHRFTAAFASLFLKNFFAEMEETFSSLHEYPLLFPKLVSDVVIDKHNEDKKVIADEAKMYLEEFLDKRKQKVKKRILAEFYGYESAKKPMTHLIDFFYKDFLVTWEKAKDCYKKNKNFKNWEKMVAISFEHLPEDLIQRLGDPDSYVAMPSSIALEHAARICGVKPNSLGLRALQKYLQQSREWVTENGEEKLNDEAGRFFRKSFGEVICSFEVANLLEQEDFPFEKYSLMHQIIAEVAGDKIKEVITEERAKQKNDELEENKLIH